MSLHRAESRCAFTVSGYFHQNRNVGDGLPFGRPAQGLALPSGYRLCAMTNCSMPINIFFTTDAVKKLAKSW
jgi:hypothetical protein